MPRRCWKGSPWRPSCSERPHSRLHVGRSSCARPSGCLHLHPQLRSPLRPCDTGGRETTELWADRAGAEVLTCPSHPAWVLGVRRGLSRRQSLRGGMRGGCQCGELALQPRGWVSSEPCSPPGPGGRGLQGGEMLRSDVFSTVCGHGLCCAVGGHPPCPYPVVPGQLSHCGAAHVGLSGTQVPASCPLVPLGPSHPDFLGQSPETPAWGPPPPTRPSPTPPTLSSSGGGACAHRQRGRHAVTVSGWQPPGAPSPHALPASHL